LIPPGTELAVEPEYLTGMDFLPEGILDMAAARRHRLDRHGRESNFRSTELLPTSRGL
jgi:hypothetical protein